jgi:hypothetical protein
MRRRIALLLIPALSSCPRAILPRWAAAIVAIRRSGGPKADTGALTPSTSTR